MPIEAYFGEWAQSETAIKLLSSFGIIVILWSIHWLINRIVLSQTENINYRQNWRKTTVYAALFLGSMLIARLWLEGIQPILNFLGLTAAALTITQKETMMNLMGWGVIMWRGLFVIGDRIEIAGHKGDVIDLGVLYFEIMEVSDDYHGQSTARMIKIPNGLTATHPVINYTHSFPYIWNEIPLTLSKESNWEKAQGLMQKIASDYTKSLQQTARSALGHIRDKAIIMNTLTPSVFVELHQESPGGIRLVLRYLCDPRKRRLSEQDLLIAILKRFEEEQEIHLIFESLQSS